MANPLGDVARWEPMGLPVGSVAMGLAMAGVGDVAVNFISGFLPVGQYKMGGLNVGTAAMKGLGAFLIAKYGGNLLGKEAATVGCLFLTADAVAELFNIRLSVNNVLGGVLGQVKIASPATVTGPGGGQSKVISGVSDTLSRSNPGL